MVIFSIMCLVIILIVIQHLLNWLWRKAWEDETLGAITVTAIIISIIVTYGIVYTIILGGKNLI